MKAHTKLTPKQRRFVAAKVSGKKNAVAYKEAGYSVSSRAVANVNASRLLHKANIQQAIDHALDANDMNPEYLVGKLKEVIEQDKEVGAKRLAIKDGLELHGWRRGDKPTVTLEIGNAFFNQVRDTQ